MAIWHTFHDLCALFMVPDLVQCSVAPWRLGNLLGWSREFWKPVSTDKRLTLLKACQLAPPSYEWKVSVSIKFVREREIKMAKTSKEWSSPTPDCKKKTCRKGFARVRVFLWSWMRIHIAGPFWHLDIFNSLPIIKFKY